MKNLILNFLILINTYSLSLLAFDMGTVSIKGLSKEMSGKYVTLYLVQAGKIIGTDYTVKKVFSRISTVQVPRNSSSATITEQNVNEIWDNLYVPNFLLAVVHENEQHCLNKYSTSIRFDPATYFNNDEFIQPTETNHSEYSRKFYPISVEDLESLRNGLTFDFSK